MSLKKTMAWLMVVLALTGCQSLDRFIYRPNTTQGQVIDAATLKKLHTGMTKPEVEQVLGKSLVTPAGEWGHTYYVYYRYQRLDKPVIRQVILDFDKARLVDIRQVDSQQSGAGEKPKKP